MIRLISLIVAALLGVFALPALAQDATPGPPDSFEIAPGVTADSAVFVEGEQNPSLYRLHFQPGVTYAVHPGPNLEIAYMEAGSLIVRLNGPAIVGEVGATDNGGEAIPAETEVTVSAGQYLVLQPGVTGDVRNDGQETATVSVAGIAPGGAATPEIATPGN